jgi:hypothetical protein
MAEPTVKAAVRAAVEIYDQIQLFINHRIFLKKSGPKVTPPTKVPLVN